MAFPKVNELCTPAYIFFVFSMVTIIASIVQNLGHQKIYSLGLLHTQVVNVFIVFIFKIVYVFLWTYILNLICKDGHDGISWLLVLYPFILLFIVMGMTGTMSKNFFVHG